MIRTYVASFKSPEEAREYYREDPSIFESELVAYIENEIAPIEELIATS